MEIILCIDSNLPPYLLMFFFSDFVCHLFRVTKVINRYKLMTIKDSIKKLIVSIIIIKISKLIFYMFFNLA